jgi:hypothetical protein
MHSETMRSVVVWGGSECEDTKASRLLLSRLGVTYQYQDLEYSPLGLGELDSILGEKLHKKPTIIVFERFDKNEEQIIGFLEEPSGTELLETMKATGLVASGVTLESLKPLPSNNGRATGIKAPDSV